MHLHYGVFPVSMLKQSQRIAGKFQNPVPTKLGGLSMMFKLLPLYFSNKEERVPKSPLGPFRTEASLYTEAPPTGLRITWMGHSSLLIEIDGVRILADPVWDERASPLKGIGPKRFYPAPLPLSELPELDVILISHDHYDHLGKDTVRALSTLPAAAHAQWIAPLAVGDVLREFQENAVRLTELDWTESTEVHSTRTGETVTITALPSRHFSGRSLRNRFETLWASFALRGTQHNIYFGADSGFWAGFSEIAREYGPFDITMLETGAWNKLWEEIHMGPEGVAKAFQSMGSQGLLMPIHWGLFDLALHAWQWPIERLTELADAQQIKLWSPTPGVPTDVETGVEHRSAWWHTG